MSNSKVKFLIEDFGWHEGLAAAFVEAKGVYQYCEKSLLDTELGYSSIVMDHLLPQSMYPEFAQDTRNHVLSCSSCNSMKGSSDILQEGENPEEMLASDKSVLIDRARENLNHKINGRRKEWEAIRDAIAS